MVAVAAAMPAVVRLRDQSESFFRLLGAIGAADHSPADAVAALCPRRAIALERATSRYTVCALERRIAT